MDKTFTLYWLTGDREILTGADIATAMTLAGYSQGALGALDFYASGDNADYEWNTADHKWQWTEAYRAKMMEGTDA